MKKDKGIQKSKLLSFSGLEIWLCHMISSASRASLLGNKTEIATKERKIFHGMNCRQIRLAFRNKDSLNPRLGRLPPVAQVDVKDHK